MSGTMPWNPGLLFPPSGRPGLASLAGPQGAAQGGGAATATAMPAAGVGGIGAPSQPVGSGPVSVGSTVAEGGPMGEGTFTETSLGLNPGKIESWGDLFDVISTVANPSMGGIIGGALATVGAGMIGNKGPATGLSGLAGLYEGLSNYGTLSGGAIDANPTEAAMAVEMAAKAEYGADYGGGAMGDKDLGGATGGSPDPGKSEGGYGGEKGEYRTGGYVDGAPGQPVSATVHTGEFVLRPEAVAALGVPLLEALNQAGGLSQLAAFAQRPPVTSWMQGAPIYPVEPPARMPEMMPEGPGQREWRLPPDPGWFSGAVRDGRRI